MQLCKLEHIIGRLRFKMLIQNTPKREFNFGYLMDMSQSVSMDVSRDGKRKKSSH